MYTAPPNLSPYIAHPEQGFGDLAGFLLRAGNFVNPPGHRGGLIPGQQKSALDSVIPFRILRKSKLKIVNDVIQILTDFARGKETPNLHGDQHMRKHSIPENLAI